MTGKKILLGSRRLNLTQIDNTIFCLEQRSKGLIEPLYDLLRKIVILKIDEPDFELKQHDLTQRFGRRKQPIVYFSQKIILEGINNVAGLCT